MARNTSIVLSEPFEDYIREKIASGKYNSASEVIRSGLRRLMTEDEKIKALNEALEAGAKSGSVTGMTAEKHLAQLHKKFL